MKPNADSEQVQESVSTVSTRRRPASVLPVPEALPPTVQMPFQPGDVLGGKYEINDLIGVGGIAFVVSARHIGFDSYVALKFLRPELAQLADARSRFTTEAQNNFRLESEHIVRVLDVDVLPQGLPYMVMELLHGRDLRTALAHGPLSVALAAEYALQVAVALAAAHANGLVHCDIKPENLFVLDGASDEPCLKVLDFGIARAVQGVPTPDRRISSSGAVGSPPYMSPEQVRASTELDARTDIWALGCVLYELLTLRVPFHRNSRTESCAAVLEQEPPPVRALRPDLPSEIESVLGRCLRKAAGDRYANVAELAEALVPFAPPRAQRHAERCRQLLSAGPRITIATDPGRRSRATPVPFIPARPSSAEAFVATQLVELIAPAKGSEGDRPAHVTSPKRRRTALLLLSTALVASAAGFLVIQRIQHAPAGGPFAAERPSTSFAKGSRAPSLAPELPPGPAGVHAQSFEAPRVEAAPPERSSPVTAHAAPAPAVAGARSTARVIAGRALSRKPQLAKTASGGRDPAPRADALRDEPDVGF